MRKLSLAKFVLICLANVTSVKASSSHLILLEEDLSHYLPFIQSTVSIQSSRVDIRMLNQQENPFKFITQWLQNKEIKNPLSKTVHILSHGSDGVLTFNGNTVNLSSLYQPEFLLSLKTLKQLSEGRVYLFLYGCNIAETDRGRQFVNVLSYLSGSSVFASENITGHEHFGGDWILEYQADFSLFNSNIPEVLNTSSFFNL